ncbi:adenine phosphoribosyltransferase [Granulosicoccaceae sp. 1_MG-2023]|nr:adenine phosphoribosyltransferase [Granulosicoccaceae sp. 1_MG-2023]
MQDVSTYYSDYIKQRIRTVPDWPAPGVKFRDITSLLHDPATLRRMIDCFIHRYYDYRLDAIACIDARGFLIGGALAYELNTSLIPIRKEGKLPRAVVRHTYELEYGEDTIEIHSDAVEKGQRILLLDDLIATGGTMRAAAKLVRQLGGDVVEAAAIVDLPELGGSARLQQENVDVFTICAFDGK